MWLSVLFLLLLNCLLSLPIEAKPEAEFSIAAERYAQVDEYGWKVYVGKNVSFTGGNSKDAENYTWDFGEGDPVTKDTQTITYMYNTTGTYLVSLTVNDEENNTDTAYGNITVVELPIAILNITDENGTSLAPDYIVEPGQVILFHASRSKGDINSYYFGYDLTQAFIPQKVSQQPIFNHSYEAEGNYSVGLRVVDTIGIKNETGREDFIKITVRSKEDGKEGDDGTEPSDEETVEPYMYIGIIIVLVILVTILFSLVNKSKEEQ